MEENPDSEERETGPFFHHLLLIGCGAMGAALLKGWLSSKALPVAKISVITPRKTSVEPFLTDARLSHYASPEELTSTPELIVFAAKPDKVDKILPLYKGLCTSKTVFISIAAGKRLASYRRLLGEDVSLVRVMPNTPSAIGLGVSLLVTEPYTVLSGTQKLSGSKKAALSTLMNAVGKSYWLSCEDSFDRATLINGCGPAYLFAILEALSHAGASLGLPLSLSTSLAFETLTGALAYLQSTSRSASDLRQEVTSPGGVTQAALTPLLDPEIGLENLFCAALHQGYERALRMGDGPNA